MGFAADAIADAITPPPRAERSSAPKRDDGPSFADHLDAQDDVTRADAPRAEKQPAERPCSTDDDQDQKDEPAEAAAQAAPPLQPEPPPVAPALLAHLFGQLKSTSETSAKPEQTSDIAGPAQATPQQGGAETAPQLPLLGGLLAQNQQQAGEESAEAAPALAAPTLLTPKGKSAAKPAAEPAKESAASTELQPAPQQLTPAEALTAPAQAPAPTAQTERASQDIAINANAPRAPKMQAPPTEARAPETPAHADAPKSATPLQQALAALREGAAAANGGEKNTEIKIAAPAQSAAPQTSAALAQAPAQAQQITLEHAAQRIAPAATQVAREIVRRFNGGNTSFDLRLDPPELGRIDVRLEVSRDHKVTAVIAADSPQALSDLVRHSRELEASLQSAGLDLAENGLSFDLNQSGQGFADDGDGKGSNARQGAAQSDDPTPAPVARPLGLESWRGVRIDVMA